MIILTKEQIVLLHSQLIEETGGSDGIRDMGLLESAISSPFQTYYGQDLYPTIEEKAVQLCFKLVKNHPMIDGNKRIGAHTMLLFLMLNGIELEYSQDELSNIILDLASGQIDSKEILKWILTHKK